MVLNRHLEAILKLFKWLSVAFLWLFNLFLTKSTLKNLNISNKTQLSTIKNHISINIHSPTPHQIIIPPPQLPLRHPLHFALTALNSLPIISPHPPCPSSPTALLITPFFSNQAVAAIVMNSEKERRWSRGCKTCFSVRTSRRSIVWCRINGMSSRPSMTSSTSPKNTSSPSSPKTSTQT